MSISEEILFEEKPKDIYSSNQVVDHEESAESGITNPRMLGTQQENITGASELRECNDMLEETTSDSWLIIMLGENALKSMRSLQM
ncbi:uncharacterized protein LOC144547259 isoform X3 [Carex rostrata]